MIGMTVAKVAEYTGGTLHGGGGAPVLGAVRDNREVAPGLMFCALPGARLDGHEFIAAALDAGAPCCLAQRVPEGVSGPVCHLCRTWPRRWRGWPRLPRRR